MPTAAWQWIGLATIALATAWLLWAARGTRSKHRRRCPKCWYDLDAAGDPPLTCPECGREITRAKDLHRRRRRPRHALAAIGLLLVGYAFIATPRVQATGWRGVVPTTVLVVALPWLPQAWHDTDFYRTGIDDEQRVALQTFMQEVIAEGSRIGAGTPATLAEELACRWGNEPRTMQRFGNHLWGWVYGSSGKPWFWMHGIERGAGVQSMAWELRQRSLHAGALSAAQARETRRLSLGRLAGVRLWFDSRDSMIVLNTASVAGTCRTPEIESFESALLDSASDEVLSAAVGYPNPGKQPVAGSYVVARIPYGTESVTLRYTLLDVEGDLIDRHTVRYQITFSRTLDEFLALPQQNRRIDWLTQLSVLEVDGEPVQKPRLP